MNRVRVKLCSLSAIDYFLKGIALLISTSRYFSGTVWQDILMIEEVKTESPLIFHRPQFLSSFFFSKFNAVNIAINLNQEAD